MNSSTGPEQGRSPSDGDLVAPSPKIAVPEDVADAVRTLIRWAGDDPTREGLRDTGAQEPREGHREGRPRAADEPLDLKEAEGAHRRDRGAAAGRDELRRAEGRGVSARSPSPIAVAHAGHNTAAM